MEADDGDEFDGPTQLVDAGTYAATVAKAQHDDAKSDPQATQELPAQVSQVDGDAATTVAPRDEVRKERAPRSDSGSLFPELSHVQLPQTLGQYTLVELLGLGGMAEVFLAQQDGPSGFRRKLVIKRIHPHLSVDERFVQMFLREARVAAGLQHRNIVRIDELGADKGVYFIAMEFVDGLTLQRLAQRAWRNGLSLPMELAVSAAADAASALHYAHSYVDADGTERRIVHRDVSPDNLIVDRAGNTKLLDFGVAKAAGSISVTRAGEVKGKVPYMAPEQLHGRPLDGRADLYSLGATLYWLLTGKRPFRGATDLEVMQAIAYEVPVPPRELNPEVPEVLDKIIVRLLAKHPDDRHENGQQLAEELSAMLPPSRREVAAFVEEAMALDNVEDSEPLSGSSFIASTPRTAHFITESRRLWLEQFLPERTAAAVTIVSEPDAEPLQAEPLKAEPLLDLMTDVGVDANTALDPGSFDLSAAKRAPLSDDDADAASVSVATVVGEPKRLPAAAMGAGAAGALLLAVIGWVLSGSDDDQLPAVPPAAVAPLASAEAKPTDADWNFLGNEVDDREAANGAAEKPKADPAKPAASEASKVKASPAVEPSVEAVEPSVAEDVEDVAVEKAAATQETPVARGSRGGPSQESKRAAPTEARRAPTLKVKATGPSKVVWKLGKRTLGNGNASFEVPEGTTALTAYHKGYQVRTRVPVQGGQVSYASAPKGTLDIRVVPYATVYAGSEKLWKVPGPPGQVPAGTYKLRIEYEGKTKTQTVTVEPGATAKVRMNMME